jgi:hypothetical protein
MPLECVIWFADFVAKWKMFSFYFGELLIILIFKLRQEKLLYIAERLQS